LFDISHFQNDVELIHEIEALIEKQLEMIEYKESEALSLMKKVCFCWTIFCSSYWIIYL